MFVKKATNTVLDADNFIQSNMPGVNDTMLALINTTYMPAPDNPVYPNAGQYWQGASNAYGEIKYICAGLTYAQAYDANPNTAATNFNYHYAVLDPESEASGIGVQHTIEVNAIWGGSSGTGNSPPSSYDTTNAGIIPLMQGYWTSFIRAFDPNVYSAPGAPLWQPFGPGKNRLFIQTNNTHMEVAPDDQLERCASISPIYYNEQ